MSQCLGSTRYGLRCTKLVKTGYCNQHRNQEKKHVLIVVVDAEYQIEINDQTETVGNFMKDLAVKMKRNCLRIGNKDFFINLDNQGIMIDILFMTVQSFLSKYFHFREDGNTILWDYLSDGSLFIVESM